jgi:GNAT superfamily N-acetyltransferase
LEVIAEIDLARQTQMSIQRLRNDCFPEHKAARSYYKQLPHYRMLKYRNEQLIGHMGLDYRVINVGDTVYKTLGVIDFCVRKENRGKGIGTSMLTALKEYAKNRDVDFVILISDLSGFYIRNGFQQVVAYGSWLRLDEHKNYGVAFEHLEDLFVMPLGDKEWKSGHIDWLGYMF